MIEAFRAFWRLGAEPVGDTSIFRRVVDIPRNLDLDLSALWVYLYS
jgi:hypothetical protein